MSAPRHDPCRVPPPRTFPPGRPGAPPPGHVRYPYVVQPRRPARGRAETIRTFWWCTGLVVPLAVISVAWVVLLLRSTTRDPWLLALGAGAATTTGLLAATIVLMMRVPRGPQPWAAWGWVVSAAGLGTAIVTGSLALVDFADRGVRAIFMCSVTIVYSEGGIMCG